MFLFDMEDVRGYWLTRLLLYRGLGVICLVAFLVALNQFRPLLGERGLLPVPLFVKQVPFRLSPSLFYLFPRDVAFATAAWLGVVLSCLVITGISERYGTWVSVAVWAAIYLLYLSFVNVGQTFYGFGWESILLEACFFAMFLGSARVVPQRIPIWLFRWLLFRIMFGAGLIKLRGDPCWRDLTCLNYYYETQPMPNPLSWYFHWAPQWMNKSWRTVQPLLRTDHSVRLLFAAADRRHRRADHNRVSVDHHRQRQFVMAELADVDARLFDPRRQIFLYCDLVCHAGHARPLARFRRVQYRDCRCSSRP